LMKCLSKMWFGMRKSGTTSLLWRAIGAAS
jgi:hypothetical protein